MPFHFYHTTASLVFKTYPQESRKTYKWKIYHLLIALWGFDVEQKMAKRTRQMPDAVLHERTGLAILGPVPELIADALQHLAKDEAYRLTLSHRSRAWAIENFSIESSTTAILNVYQRLAQPSESKWRPCAF